MRAQERAVLGTSVSPTELQQLIHADRRGAPFLFLRDEGGAQRLITPATDRLVLGRAAGSDLEIAWDGRVSGVHAYLELRGSRWVIEDDGLSRNGTFVNGERLQGQRILRDGDVIGAGDTLLGFRHPEPEPVLATISVPTVAPPEVSQAQHRVLVALCRPLTGEGLTAPATNEQIATELVLSLSAVKGHLRVLFSRFALDDAPQNQKRLLLAERALATSVVRPSDL
ncbi:MAG: FHA domain-containing protein [Candidatus Dormibacteraeota bacterium]|nr:FHA domain-containing protein [Candidatus Dormibacteraeota bacterium]